MKQLTKQQLKRLFILLDRFLPQYIFISWKDLVTDLKYWKKGSEHDSEPALFTCWLEVCLIYLPKVIWQTMVDEDLNDDKEFDFEQEFELNSSRTLSLYVLESFLDVRDKVHPIDCLWNFVKECEQRKYLNKTK